MHKRAFPFGETPVRSGLARCLFCLMVLLVSACSTTVPIRPESGLPEPRANLANSVAFRALSLVGMPYVYGGQSPTQGFDCSGFVRYVYLDAVGRQLPRTTAEQAQIGPLVGSSARLRLGDLVFFQERGKVFHVGLYVGEGRFVHAPRTGKRVELSSLSSGYWHSRFALARRLL